MLTKVSLKYLLKSFNFKFDWDEDVAVKYAKELSESIQNAEKQMEEFLHPTKEYPPFVYYLVLEHMDGNTKYNKPLRLMTDEEKTKVFNETINALKGNEYELV